MGDFRDGANNPHWYKGASHEWGKPYSDDLRERVVAAIEVGHTRAKVAELYNIALSTVGGFARAVPRFLIGGSQARSATTPRKSAPR
jgi:transposase